LHLPAATAHGTAVFRGLEVGVNQPVCFFIPFLGRFFERSARFTGK
jgi:hypothetical protein